MRCLFCFLFFLSSAFAEVSLTVADRKTELQEVKVAVQLQGRFRIRDLTLVFYNENARRAEGDLRCPLDVGEEIVSFAMDVNGVRRDGVVVPKKRARFAYETIISRGVDPGLLEVDEEANEFRTRVFPIPGKGTKTVWIRTVKLVEAGEVQLWPQDLGRPKKWELTVVAAGGKGAMHSLEESGDAEMTPEKKMTWRPAPGLAYQSDHGSLHFAQEKEKYEESRIVEIWLDGTGPIKADALDRLRQLLIQLGSSKVILKVFREEVEEAREFMLTDHQSPALFAAISGIQRLGMARPQKLPWRSVSANAVVMITDGTFAGGRAGFPETGCPFHVIDSGLGTSKWLRSRALKSGGGWHCLENHPSFVTKGAQMVGEVMGKVFLFKPEKRGLKTPIGNWLWARLRSQQMSERGERREVIDAFQTKHGVMDSESSMIVMETVGQYLEFGIEPPKSDEALYRNWLSLQDREKQKKKADLAKLSVLWKERCDRLEKRVPPLGLRMIEKAEERAEELARLFVISPRSDLGTVAPLLIELKALRALAVNGVSNDEVERVKEHLARTQKLEGDLDADARWLRVTIGGQVRKAGVYHLPWGATLWAAIEVAGGKTPFGAINRVKVYRSGKAKSYDLRNTAAKQIRLYPGDIVEVPQTNFLGNGGRPGKTQAPFANAAPQKIAFRKGDSNPPKYYLDDLAKWLEDEDQWWERYGVYRAACGWRADFYLNVIAFLDEQGEKTRALRVAGDLAEHLPDHPEVLRKAAMAYRRLGEKTLSGELFERLVAMQPDSAVALFDLARSKQAQGNDREALALYWKAARIDDSRYTVGRSLIVLEEMNALIARSKLNAAEFGIDPGLVRHVPIAFRVVMEWDAFQSNLDLVVRKPMGQAALRHTHSGKAEHEWWSGNLSEGYGPESWSAQGFFPGTHEIVARFYGDWNEQEITTVTAEVEVIRNFGTSKETRERHSLRVKEKTEEMVVKADVFPEGWE